MTEAPQLIDEATLAKALGVSPRTLQAQRFRGGGIPFIKLGRSVRYDAHVVRDYLMAHRRSSTSGNFIEPPRQADQSPSGR